MLQIIYNGTVIDLAPEQAIEIERHNPMFMLDNVFGEYSTPITVKYTERNARTFRQIFNDKANKTKVKVDVEVYDDGSFAYNATLVLNKSRINRKFAANGNASGLLLIGISRLYNALKDVKANTLSYGGARVYNYTTLADDGSDGYWQHFHDTWAGNLDYVIAPVHNPKLFGDSVLDTGWQNKLDEATSKLQTFSPLTLFPRASYVLQQIFIEHGWSIDTSAMDGTGWDELFLYSAATMEYWTIPLLIPYSSIGINIRDFIDPEVSAFDIVYHLCRKYGWVPIPSIGEDKITLIPLMISDTGEVKDLTPYASAVVDNEFVDTERTFSFKNNFKGNDSFPDSTPDFEGKIIGQPVVTGDDLPDPTTGAFDRTVIFVYRENKWYQVVYDEVAAERVWEVFSDNIYDEEVDSSTDTFESDVTTLPIYKTKYREAAAIEYFGWFPYCEQETFKSWGIRTMLYLGMCNEVKEDGTDGPNQYPHLSCIRCTPEGAEVASFSNVFKHLNPDNNEDNGIIEYWFRQWLDMVNSPEINEQRLNLPLHILKKLNWSDQVILFNIPYFVMSFIEPRSYTGFIQARLKRIQSAAVSENGSSTGTIYVKLFLEDEQAVADYGIPDPIYGGSYNYSDILEHKVIARFFSDLACTMPVAVSGLTVIFHQLTKKDGATYVESDNSLVCNGTEKNYADWWSGTFTTKEYNVAYTGTNPNPIPDPGFYEFIFSIGASPDYVVVP